MGTQDRDWYRDELKKRQRLRWNDRSGELEYDQPPRRRRWRWPYRLRPNLPWWARELVRQTLFWGVIAMVYLAWRNVG